MKHFIEDLALSFIFILIFLLPLAILVTLILMSYFWSLLMTILITSMYGSWMYMDRYTDARGGRASSYLRRLSIWSKVSDYFPVKLVKTEDLDPNRNYIFGYHPHGRLTVGVGVNFLTEATHFSTLFPGIRPHLMTIRFNFLVPFSRELLLNLGNNRVKNSSSYVLLL